MQPQLILITIMYLGAPMNPEPSWKGDAEEAPPYQASVRDEDPSPVAHGRWIISSHPSVRSPLSR